VKPLMKKMAMTGAPPNKATIKTKNRKQKKQLKNS
jgi:hypothetical protein